jgi:hypothetical protein
VRPKLQTAAFYQRSRGQYEQAPMTVDKWQARGVVGKFPISPQIGSCVKNPQPELQFAPCMPEDECEKQSLPADT